MSTEESATLAEWADAFQQADDLDPVIWEALRPVYDRLKAEAPHSAAGLALAMIQRALRMIRTSDGADPEPYRQALVHVALIRVRKE